MDIAKMLEELGEIPISLSDEERSRIESERKLRALPEEEKIETAFIFKMQGTPVQSIARAFDVHISTIYRWFDKYADEYRSRLEQKPAANLVAESLQFINKIKELALYEANLVGRGSDVKIDGTTGEVSRKGGNPSLKVKYYEAALKAERLALNLMLDTGIIPKQPDKIYHTLKGEKPLDDSMIVERDEEEIRRDVWKLLQRGRRL